MVSQHFAVTPPDSSPSAHSSPPGPERRGPWNSRRTALHRWLEERAPQAAELYAGGIAILDDDAIPGRHKLLWHIVREIRGHLPHKINGFRTKRFDPNSYIQAVRAAWDDAGLATGAAPPAVEQAEPDASGPLESVAIPEAVADAVAALLEADADSRLRFRAASQMALSTIFGGDVPPYVANAWTELFEHAANRAHLGNEDPALDLTHEAVQGFLAFEGILLNFTNRHFENMDEIDDILRQANADT